MPDTVNITTPAPAPVADTAVPTWAVRLEAKVDVALAQHGARLDSHASDLTDHETRLREVEQRKTVSPMQLWTAVASAVAVIGTVVGVVNNLIPA